MDWIPLISGFVGVLVGSAGSILITYLQERSASNRDRARLAIEAALADFREAAESAKRNPVDTVVPPLSAYIHYHSRIFELIAKNRMNAAALKALDEEQSEIMHFASNKFYNLNPSFKKSS